MMARGFRPVGWVAALGVAALGCYMLSLRVASERADLARLDRKIIAAQQNIRTLQTEVGTRSRIPQLEDWNEEVLALSAPAAGQFIESNVSLARFDMRAPPAPLDAPAEVRLASAEAAPPAAQSATPAPRRAIAAPAAAQPQVRRASLEVGAEPPAPKPGATRAAPPRDRGRPGPAPIRAATAPASSRPATTPTRTASREERNRLTPGPARTAPREERRRPAATTAPVRTAAALPSRARPAAATSAARAATSPARQTRGERQRGTRD
ncbi:MAG TPA: hypothetical protein VEX35_13990 [Allosphingosinicella sp.]|nr:hypothetical protein [Allosphingosinicella sp.]